MNLLEMADEILTRIGAASDDALLAAATRKSFVNAALRRLDADLRAPDWLVARETITTVPGFSSHVVPAGWAKTLSLRIVTEAESLPYVGPQALGSDYGASGDPAGTPSAWHQEGGVLYLRPTPSAAIEIEHRYSRVEPTLASDAATPLLPARFHDAVVEKACVYAARRIGQYERSREHQKEYEGWVKTMVDEQNRVTTPPRIRTR